MPLFMKCQINNRKSKASPTQTWITLGKLLVAYNFPASLFCTAQSLFSLDFRQWQLATSWWLSQSCDSYAAAFGGSQAKKNSHCMMAGNEFENHATVHEMSNQQSLKEELLILKKCPPIYHNNIPQNKPGSPLQLRFLALHNLYLGPFQTLRAGGCPKSCDFCAAAFAVEMWAHMSQITNTA